VPQTQAESDYLNRNITLNFKVREFLCPCCGEEGIKEALVYRLQNAHDLQPVNRMMIVTSGYRCPAHNKQVGGVEDSAHTKGLAADIRFDNANHKFMLMKALFYAGFKRIGTYKSWIHVDIDTTKPQEVIW